MPASNRRSPISPLRGARRRWSPAQASGSPRSLRRAARLGSGGFAVSISERGGGAAASPGGGASCLVEIEMTAMTNEAAATAHGVRFCRGARGSSRTVDLVSASAAAATGACVDRLAPGGSSPRKTGSVPSSRLRAGGASRRSPQWGHRSGGSTGAGGGASGIGDISAPPTKPPSRTSSSSTRRLARRDDGGAESDLRSVMLEFGADEGGGGGVLPPSGSRLDQGPELSSSDSQNRGRFLEGTAAAGSRGGIRWSGGGCRDDSVSRSLASS